MIDDGERLSQILILQGVAFLSTINLAISEGEFKSDSSLRNLGLVLALLIKYVNYKIPEISESGEGTWDCEVVRLADKHGASIGGPWGIENDVEGIRDRMDDETELSWKKWNWKKQIGVFGRVRYRRADQNLYSFLYTNVTTATMAVPSSISQRCLRLKDRGTSLEEEAS